MSIQSRCIHCMQPKEGHTPETLFCIWTPSSGLKTGATKYATRELPEGCTCADCFHFKRTCEWLISYKGTETSCDWFPIKFAGPIVREKAATS